MDAPVPPKIMIIAGEASGDQHAAHLVKALKEINPSLSFSGIGGPLMKEAGVDLFRDMTKLAVIGFIEVLKHYGEIKKIFNQVLSAVDEQKPAAVILVDYPGFNLRLAKKLHEKRVKVIYYISPQVWAWKEKRVQQIKRDITRMLVLFGFEFDFYKKRGVDVSFVGHPLLDAARAHTTPKEIRDLYGLDRKKLTVALMPGSREKEIDRHLPLMLQAAGILKKIFPMIQFLIIKADTVKEMSYEKILKDNPLSVPLIKGRYYDTLHASDACLVASGTATLETALFQKPMVIIYKTSWITWFLAKLFVKIPFVGLVNIVAGKEVVPEYLQSDATPEKVSAALKEIITNEIRIADIKSDLACVKTNLGQPGASRRAAEEVMRVMRAEK